MPLAYEQTRTGLHRHMTNHAQYGFGLYAVLLKANGLFIGRGGLTPAGSSPGGAGELAWLLQPTYWGYGLATELGCASIAYGLTRLWLKRIFVTPYRADRAWIRVMEQLSMHQVRADGDEVEYEV